MRIRDWSSDVCSSDLSNGVAPVSGRADCESRAYLAGASLLADARSAAPAMTPEIPAFVRRMDQRGPWTPLPILFANAESGGPVEHAFFLDRKSTRLNSSH